LGEKFWGLKVAKCLSKRSDFFINARLHDDASTHACLQCLSEWLLSAYGEKVTLTVHPAPAGHGRKFRRLDLPEKPVIEASVSLVKTVERATTLGEGTVKVHTVEHVLSALAGLGVDNALN
jgi:hypothetical protein